MKHEEQSFMEAMLETPNDLSLRQVFADWLEERGDPRGELLRLTHTLTQSVDVSNRSEREDRLRGLLAEGVQAIGPFWTNSVGMKFAWIPAGTFLMGSPPDEEERERNEIQHKVTLSKGFFMGIHLVTQEQWQSLMGDNPSHFKGNHLPVEQISWNAWVFCEELSQRDGKKYRLPTEAEWEYACRAGTTTPFHFGETISTKQANYNGNHVYGHGTKGEYRQQTTPVGSFPANAWGLYDMHGNVWERCNDLYGEYSAAEVTAPQGPDEEDYLVVRGGSWGSDPRTARSAFRLYDGPLFGNVVGFRVVCCLD